MNYPSSQIIKPQKLYDRRFSVHFSPIPGPDKEEKKEEDEEGEEERRVRKVVVNGGSYDSTIVCYNTHDEVLEVRKDRLIEIHTDRHTTY